MSLRGPDTKGTDLLLQHVLALEERTETVPAFARLSEAIGERLATMLVSALAGDHAQPAGARELVA